MASPNPKPKELKKLQGTDRADRGSGDRMDPIKMISVPEPPEFLGEHGKGLWKQQLQQLAHLQMLTVVDLTVLGQYCKEYDIYMSAINHIDSTEEGWKNKHDQVSPAVSVKNQAFKNMLQIADRFGFVASAREKLTMPERKEQDPLEQHMSKLHSVRGGKQSEPVKITDWVKKHDLNARIATALIKAKVKTYADLKKKYQAGKLKGIKGLGPKYLKQIDEVI